MSAVDPSVDVVETRNAGWVFRCHRCDRTKMNLTEDAARTLAAEHVHDDQAPAPWSFDVSEIPMHITCVETVGWDGTLWYRLGQRDVWTTDINKSRDGSGLATRHLLQYAPIVERQDPRVTS